MIWNDSYLQSLSKPLKYLVAAFVIVLAIGFFTGIRFVQYTTNNNPEGIAENYNGNEADEAAEIMKFKKSSHEMLNIIHTHILSMSILFFLIALLVYGTILPMKLKMFLMIEPFVSIIASFGGIYMLWLDYGWMRYIVMISGILMTISFAGSSISILYSLTLKAEDPTTN